MMPIHKLLSLPSYINERLDAADVRQINGSVFFHMVIFIYKNKFKRGNIK